MPEDIKEERYPVYEDDLWKASIADITQNIKSLLLHSAQDEKDFHIKGLIHKRARPCDDAEDSMVRLPFKRVKE